MSEVEELQKDAARWRALRQLTATSLAGSVNVDVDWNREALYYREVEPGKVVEVRWYPVTPIGFHNVTAATLDEAMDTVVAHLPPNAT